MRGTIAVCLMMGLLAVLGCQRGAAPEALAPEPEPSNIGEPLYAPAPVTPSPLAHADDGPAIVITEARLAVIDKEDVPGQYNGFLRVIGTEIKPNEAVPPDEVFTVKIANEDRQFRRLKVGDVVEAGQLLGQLDDTLVRNELYAKRVRFAAARAELPACEKALEEAEKRYETQVRLAVATSEEELRAARVNWEKARSEYLVKKEGCNQANLELEEAEIHLQMQDIRSKIPGIVRAILKQPGESVRNAEPVFQVQDLSRLRVEGLVDAQHLPGLHTGMKAIVEPSRAQSPLLVLKGHLQEVNAVAVSSDARWIVSGSEDGTARVWEMTSGRETRLWRHPDAVRCVACSPAGDLCLTGCADGIARIWSLDGAANVPQYPLSEQHAGAVTCVAFSPDGKFCVTGGEDRNLCLWEAATGQLRYRFPEGHRGAVTSVEFTPQCGLVSAGRDNTLRIWELGEQGARLEATIDGRGGDVARLGVSPDGAHVLFDLGRELRLLSLPPPQPRGLGDAVKTEAVLQNLTDAASFAAFALFSPDARAIVSAGASDGVLWKAPTATARGQEWCRLVAPESNPPTCAAFAPSGNYLVTGMRSRHVLVWAMPATEELERSFVAQVTWLERSVESNAGQVRIWAEIANPDQRLLPGTPVTMTICQEPGDRRQGAGGRGQGATVGSQRSDTSPER